MPTFAGSTGSVHYERWLPDGEVTRIVIIVHGYAEYAARYAHVAAQLNADGAAVYAEDHMGHGHSDGERALITDFGNVVADLRSLYNIATEEHPGAPVAAHPECPPAIIDHADYVGSTSGILKYAENFEGDTLIVATEPHIMHQMEKALPNKTFIGAPGADGNCSCNICPYMALNTMEKMYTALRDLEPRIEIEEGIRRLGEVLKQPVTSLN